MTRTLVDGEEAGLATSDDPDSDPLLDTQENPAKFTPDDEPRPSARALYVPSPLPMNELKKALLDAAEDDALSAAPTLPPPPHVEGSAPVDAPALERAIDRRFVSIVDTEEVEGSDWPPRKRR